MPFATSNVSRGTQGNHRVLTGQWTGSANDADGSMTVEGGQIYGLEFLTHLSTGPVERVHAYNASTSGAITTITVSNRQAVTAGTFRIEYL